MPADRVTVAVDLAQSHHGSLVEARILIQAAAMCGVDVVKFQTHLPCECALNDPRRDAWRRTGFTPDQWGDVAGVCRGVGVEFMSSPFSPEAVEILDPLVSRWKVASGEVTHRPLLEAIRATGKPVWLSTGMTTEAEDAIALDVLDGVTVTVLQCVSLYPAPPRFIHAEWLYATEWRNWGWGLSDHSGTIFPGLAAVSRSPRASVVEVHAPQDGPDAKAALSWSQLAELVKGIRFIEQMGTVTRAEVMALPEIQAQRAKYIKWERRDGK